MRFSTSPAAAIGLVALATIHSVAAKPYPNQVGEARELQNATQLERRIVCGSTQTPCGQDGGYTCCESNQQCSTDPTNNQAICVAASGGSWSFTTIYYTSTDLLTRTTVLSSYVGGAVATPQPTAACGSSQTSCGAQCCDSGYWCQSSNVCKPVGGSTPAISATGSPTTTVPFSSPIATGASGTPVESNAGSGGLSGGAIAGIVIGVIAGIILLLLICFYCCAKAAFDSVLALIGLGGKKKRRHEESTYIEEHHHHGGSAAAGGRRWYGQGSSRPSRPPMKEKSSGMGGLLGLGAGLAGLAAVLGMKRKHDARHDDKSTTISGSSYYYSDYTSSSSASSDDRRTRHTRHSSRR